MGEAHTKEPKSILEYIEDGLEELDVDDEAGVRSYAEEVAICGMCDYPMNHHRSITTAAALYVALFIQNEKKDQEVVADALDVSPLSLRKAYQTIKDERFG